MVGEKKGVGVRVYVDGEATAKRSFDDIADSGKKMFAEIAVGSKTAAPGITGLSRGVEGAGAGFKSMAGGSGAALAGVAAMGVAAVAAAAAVQALAFGLQQAREGMDFASELADTAKALGVTTDALQEWRYVLRVTGSDEAAADKALEKFRINLGKAKADLGDGAIKPFEALGLDKDSLNGFKDADEALNVVIERISGLSDEAEQAAIAEKLGLTEMLPAIRQGGTEISRLREEAHRLGLVMDAELIGRAAETKTQFETVSKVIDIQLKQAFVDLGPVIVSIMELVAKLATALGDLADSWRDLEDKSMRGLRSELVELKADRNRLGIAQMMGDNEAGPYGTSAERAAQRSAMNFGDTSMVGVPIKSAIGNLDSRIAGIETLIAGREVPAPKTGGVRLVGGGGGKGKTGPTPEEQAEALRAIELEQKLAVARARGDDAATDMLESEQFLAAQRDRYVKAGLSLAEAQARAQDDADARIRAANLKAARDEEGDWIRRNTQKPVSGAGITDLLPTDGVVGPDGTLWTQDQKQAWARDVGDATAEGLDAALHGDFVDWFKQRLYRAAFDGLSDAVTQALANADFSGGGGGGGGGGWFDTAVNWFASAFGGGQTSGRAAGGTMAPGGRYSFGEHGRPELAMLGGNGYVADHEATQRMLAEAMNGATGAGGGGSGSGPRRLDIYLNSEVKIPPGHVSDRQLYGIIQAAHDDAVNQALKQSGAAVGKQQADARFLKG